MRNATDKPKWTGWHTFSLLVIIVAVALVGLQVPSRDRFVAWLVILALLTLFAVIAGHGVTGLWRGLLIDERNRMSLSRLQMTLWSILVVSGFLTAALSNLAAGQPDPLSIAIPGELWLAMGMGTTSPVGSPLIKSTKKDKQPDEKERQETLEKMAQQTGVNLTKVASKGQIVVYTRPEEAGWSDLFRGEETGNAAQLDLAKVQMFYFTLILVVVYAAALGAVFAGNSVRIGEFPALDPSAVALLGISHAGYLTNKAVRHSKGQ